MRNLKKIITIVLIVVIILSIAIIVINSSNFKQINNINAKVSGSPGGNIKLYVEPPLPSNEGK